MHHAPSLDRRSLIQLLSGLLLAPRHLAAGGRSRTARPNLLLLTADDLDHDSLGCTGCPVPELSPNLDRLASQGLRFEEAHVTVSECRPSRHVILTGRLPQHQGSKGWQPIREDVSTLPELLAAAGYRTGILSKVDHLAPLSKFPFELQVKMQELGLGRDPVLYAEHTRAFLEADDGDERPFFLMVNCEDPHRPFPGSEQEKDKWTARNKAWTRRHPNAEGPAPYVPPPVRREFDPAEVPVPGFLPDLPEVRQEMAEYFAAVHRLDETMGVVLAALEDAGHAEDTLVIFLSDHGMSFPFAKGNCYRSSTRTPLIVRWPGEVEPGTIDSEHLVGGVDLVPTILAALGVEAPEGLDGRSFLELLRGQPQAGREHAFTLLDRTASGDELPMRSVQGKRYGFIMNAWSDGRTGYKHPSAQAGLTYQAMVRAARDDEHLAQRLELYRRRQPEELYDYEKDPYCLVNLVDKERYAEVAAELRAILEAWMQASDDPLLGRKKRDRRR